MARKRIMTEDGPKFIDDTFGPQGAKQDWGTIGPQMYQSNDYCGWV